MSAARDALPRLNIIGAGRLGQTLGHLWQAAGTLHIGGVCNRSLDSAQRAVEVIGAGTALNEVAALPPAELTLIATPDSEIATAAAQLAERGPLRAGNIVFHASGAHPSALLSSLSGAGVLIASVHPIRAFADPLSAAAAFAPTFCGAEGDETALAVLEPLFAAIGAECLRIDAARKPLYHAAAVLASNYLVGLVDLSLAAYAQAGVARADAQRLLAPILNGTLANIQTRDTVAALTGPVARGDADTIDTQMTALATWRDDAATVYASLGQTLLTLAEQQGAADPEGLARIAALFNDHLRRS